MPTSLTLTPTGQTLTVPTRWADVSLAQFVALQAPSPADERTGAELLLGLPAGGLGQLASRDVSVLLPLLDFATDPGPVLELLPTPDLPDAGSLPYNCLLLVQQHLEAHADRPDLASLPYVLAVYRTQLRDGQVSAAALERTLAALLAAPVTESYPDGSFFLRACRSWQPGTPATPPTSSTWKTKNSKPTPTRRWLRALGRRLRSTRWPRVT